MKFSYGNIKRYILGAPRDPFSAKTRHGIALVAFFAWIGIGADGLSSSCYGPEEAFLALGTHSHLSLYLAIATALTVFIISMAYNQVIELFPSGGGGYKVSTDLIGPYAGLVAGSSLIVDYVLTITISIASAIDALFSMLPLSFQPQKLTIEIGALTILLVLNLRGMKESIKVLMPIFLGFVLTHTFLILYGILSHKSGLITVFSETVTETTQLAGSMGWLFVSALFLRAYSLGGGTYTGLEAVSNNVNRLAEPRVKTGKWTMFYMALSLSFTAGGIILLYLLWHVQPTAGQTLNATVFSQILNTWTWGHDLLWIVLALEAGLLFVGANTGILGGPAVLANMAVDKWVPNRYHHLSNRLITQNGVILFGVAALAILLLSGGRVSWLVVLYSINVFLTFSLSLLGLCIYWWRARHSKNHWLRRFILSFIGLLVSFSILLTTLILKFTFGGWVTVLVTGIVIFVCLAIHKHYQRINKQLKRLNHLLPSAKSITLTKPLLSLTPGAPTAVFMVGKNIGVTMHTLLWAQRLFPQHFKNFIFIGTGIVDIESYGGKDKLAHLKKEVGEHVEYFVRYCQNHDQAAAAYSRYGTDPIKESSKLAIKIHKQFPNAIFFTSKLVFEHDNWFTKLLHNEAAFSIQRRLHLKGIQLIILPIKVT